MNRGCSQGAFPGFWNRMYKHFQHFKTHEHLIHIVLNTYWQYFKLFGPNPLLGRAFFSATPLLGVYCNLSSDAKGRQVGGDDIKTTCTSNSEGTGRHTSCSDTSDAWEDTVASSYSANLKRWVTSDYYSSAAVGASFQTQKNTTQQCSLIFCPYYRKRCRSSRSFFMQMFAPSMWWPPGTEYLSSISLRTCPCHSMLFYAMGHGRIGSAILLVASRLVTSSILSSSPAARHAVGSSL